MTRFRLLTINCRRSTYLPDMAFPSRRWANRKPYMIRFIRDVAPSVITAQECTKTQVVDMTNGLGPNWTFFGEPSNRQVLWDGLKWDANGAHTYSWQSKTEQTATFVRLMRRETGDQIWVVSCHLTQGAANATYRHQEIRKILDHLHTLPGYQLSAICGDLNSDGEVDGVRRVAGEAGWKSLRAKTSNGQLVGEDYSTFNGWKRTETSGRWIDDVLTPAGVKPYKGGVELDCLRVYPICASDHNGLRVSMEY